MFRPSIQKTTVLFVIALFNVILFYAVVSTSVLTEKAVNYDKKIIAANMMDKAISQLQKHSEKFRKKLKIPPATDPFNSYLVFGNDSRSPLVTDLGDPEAKATVLKPNFSALVMNELERAGLQKGDTVAISMTGSMPGANIAVIVACEAMGLNYISISSLGASTGGATDMNFSWPKMEKVLYDEKLISQISNKFSYGGAADYLKRGKGYRKDYGGYEKRQQLDSLMQSIYPDSSLADLFVLHGLSQSEIVQKTVLRKSVEKRLDFYKNQCDEKDLSCYKAYINIGGSVASIGLKAHGKLSKKHYGFINPSVIQDVLPPYEKSSSVIIKFSDSNIPTINFIKIEKLIKKNNGKKNDWISIAYFNDEFDSKLDLVGNGVWDENHYEWNEEKAGQDESYTDINNNNQYDKGEPFKDQDGVIDIGKGNLFYAKRFNMLIVWAAFFMSASMTAYIGFISYRQINRQMREYNPDE